MTPLDLVLLAVAGLIGGAVNSIAGGGSLVVFPALMGTGLTPLAANVTNSIGQLPSYVGGVFGFRSELTGERHRLPRLVVASMLGSLVGCVLLLNLPSTVFNVVVPVLVLLASGLLAFQQRIKLWAAARATAPVEQAADSTGDQPTNRPPVKVLVGVFVCAIYGGYFGGALGVILVGALALLLPDRLRRINAVKTVISLAVAAVTVVAFGLFGPVDWIGVAVVAPAALIGGLIGAKIALKVRDDVLRWLVVVLGVGVGIYLIIRAVRGG